MAETTTTTGTAPAAGGEGQTPQQTNQQPTTPTAEQRTAFQKFWDSLFGGKEEPAPGSGEGTKKDGDPAPKEGEGTKQEPQGGKSYSEADVEAKDAEAKQKAEETGAPAGAMVLPDGRVVTGKTSSLLGASAALLLNALKAMAGIRSDMNLISNQVIEPISALKIQSLGHHNPRLHSDEVLIALAISALTNPLADMARAQLGTLRGCDAHFSVIISEEDIKLYKRLGIHVSCEPKYESKRLYHK